MFKYIVTISLIQISVKSHKHKIKNYIPQECVEEKKTNIKFACPFFFFFFFFFFLSLLKLFIIIC
jgi:hypothetical protein